MDSYSDGARRGERCGNRSGRSLVELLVALTILALGGGLSVRVLTEATRELEGAELGLRAVMLLSQGHEGLEATSSRIPVGSGTLVLERAGSGAATVRFEPRPGSVGGDAGLLGYSGGLRRARHWTLESPSILEPMGGRTGSPDGAPGAGHDVDAQ